MARTGGGEVVAMERSGAAPTLDGYVVARGQDLLRTAWLLTGEEGRAGRLARGALAAVWRHASEPAHWREGSLDAAVRRALVARYVRRWPGADANPSRGPSPSPDLPTEPIAEPGLWGT